jgi:hypothetical protein
MHKTTVYLDEGALAKLRAMAAREAVKPAALIRRAVAQLVDDGAASLPPPGVGKYRSGRSDVSVTRKALLREAARRGRW